MNNNSRSEQRRMQVYNQMRAPKEGKPFALQWHVIQAMRRSSKIANGEAVYQDALAEVLNGSAAEVLDDLDVWAKGIVSRELEEEEKKAGIKIIVKAYDMVNPDEGYPSLAKFNREFLNGKGEFALVFSVIVDAADLDLVALDKYRGGPSLQAAYEHPRPTQVAKREGQRVQALLKQLASFDEEAMSSAAGHYVVYRHKYHGNLQKYKKEELGRSPKDDDRYLRRWFKLFNEALGYPASKPGRPPKPPQSRALQRKVQQERRRS